MSVAVEWREGERKREKGWRTPRGLLNLRVGRVNRVNSLYFKVPSKEHIYLENVSPWEQQLTSAQEGSGGKEHRGSVYLSGWNRKTLTQWHDTREILNDCLKHILTPVCPLLTEHRDSWVISSMFGRQDVMWQEKKIHHLNEFMFTLLKIN